MSADLVVFGEDWGRHPSSTQHLVSHLLCDRKALWVNSVGLRRPRLTMSDFRRLVGKGVSMLRGRNKQEGASGEHTPIILEPKVLPFPGNPVAGFVNRHSLGRAINTSMRSAGIRHPVLWMSLPTAVDAVGTMGERAVVYYCGDDFASLAGVDHEAVSALERKLAERADLILVASPTLADKFPSAKTHLIPHGVDLDLFQTPAPRPTDLPNGRPVAGFYGSISDWVDVELIASAAKLLPEWCFVLVGPVRTNIAPLKDLGNVRLLGQRPHEALPGYVQNWDVSLLPFRDTPQIRACNPLKLREYLAAGRPIVATDFPALDGYRDLIRVVDGPRSFAASLCDTLKEGARHVAERRDRVRSESWEARAAKVSELLEVL